LGSELFNVVFELTADWPATNRPAGASQLAHTTVGGGGTLLQREPVRPLDPEQLTSPPSPLLL